MKKDPLSKAQQIEEQIKKLQEKQKQYIEKAQKEIGRYLMETWDIEDVDQAKLLIEKFKEEAKKCFDESKQEEVDEKEASDQRYTEAH
ncbi:hypothetical protein P9246_10845 [Aeribacillus pallidus]|uniref:hypothetical protein n=1 Tax=Aeribacillus composti TaxID=1868734 RepID=UPI002E209321|nr:hypothetical protein [Aeribacillus composti]MED4487238.1 hypothetical protein [Aeribacillus pallidus]